MKFPLSGMGQAILLCIAGCAMVSATARAQGAPPLSTVVPGERLSDWLLRNAGPYADTTALHWQVMAERASQEQLRQATLRGLEASVVARRSPEMQGRLSDWLRSLPLTGRLTVAVADARWLQAVPEQDPVLQDGHRVLLPQRPTAVTVVTEEGRPCNTTHAPGALVMDYVRACLGVEGAAQVDWAWVAQPDGRTAAYGVAAWSMEPQFEPGPGAWIWAPGRAAGITRSTSDNLARFLATQLPGELSAAGDAVRPSMATAQASGAAPPRTAQLTSSDWGEIGLMQTPSARMAPTGDARLHLGRVDPYTRGTVMFQPLDWLEAGFRYTDVSNRLYGPTIAGTQSYKDKSIDFKLRLMQEDHIWPQLALGVRDVGGTGLFAAEYVVASKRWGDWDASVGLGWGYLGARGNLKNPLSIFGDKFNTRPGNTNTSGGTANLKSLFRGPTALFGGIQWHSPLDPWILKLELDGNDYQSEPQANNQPAKSRVNVGAVYRYSPHIDLSVGVERGNRLMVGVTMHGGLGQFYSPKLLDPVLPLVQAAAPTRPPPGGWQETSETVGLYTGWSVLGVTHQGNTTTLVAETNGAVHLQERIERAIRVLHRDAPASSVRLVLQLQERGLAMSQVEVDRAEWVASHTQVQPPALRLPSQQALPGQPVRKAEPDTYDAPSGYWRNRASGSSAQWGPSYSHILGGPDGFLLYQIGVQASLEHRFSDRTWISGDFNLRLLDNYDKFTYTAPSNLPRVRTFQREYVTSSRTTMPLLQLTHLADLGGGHYVSGYAGMLESMYAGVGAEWLYRPWRGDLAWGVDVNRVRQRDFGQKLGLRDYGVTTGHATMYWNTGWNDVQVNLSVGRYLAADLGATLDVKRVFRNGVALGAWATKTNVSAARFGEGSFDKGIYVSIPFDVMLPVSTATTGHIVWNPLTRDGGARLNRRFPLYDLTRQRDPRALAWRPANPATSGSADDTTYVLTEPSPHALETLGDTTTTLGRQISGIPASTWLWAGGAVLASSLLDKRTERWAANHQTGNWNRAGRAANAVPYALALGAGVLYTGIAGEGAGSTAETAIKAAAYTLGTNLALRYAVGRARPDEGLGNREFRGLQSGASRSSFASGHVGVAFALATPFAQQHDMPWLYGLAAATAFGRVQKREHWLSDTVAGAAMGYAIGSLLTDQQAGRTGMRLSVTPQSVVANWSFD